ncbi:hypothetical protein Drorol1_Dr00010112 [Drosera rotundifolia]
MKVRSDIGGVGDLQAAEGGGGWPESGEDGGGKRRGERARAIARISIETRITMKTTPALLLFSFNSSNRSNRGNTSQHFEHSSSLPNKRNQKPPHRILSTSQIPPHKQPKTASSKSSSSVLTSSEIILLELALSPHWFVEEQESWVVEWWVSLLSLAHWFIVYEISS